jgi:hypothetical protein
VGISVSKRNTRLASVFRSTGRGKYKYMEITAGEIGMTERRMGNRQACL